MMILLKKQTTKLLTRLRGWQAGLGLYCYKSRKTGFLSRGPIAICVI